MFSPAPDDCAEMTRRDLVVPLIWGERFCHGDGVADATEGVVAAVAAVGGDELTANWRQYCTEQAAIQRQTAA